jgi:hypothetical protein
LASSRQRLGCTRVRVSHAHQGNVGGCHNSFDFNCACSHREKEMKRMRVTMLMALKQKYFVLLLSGLYLLGGCGGGQSPPPLTIAHLYCPTAHWKYRIAKRSRPVAALHLYLDGERWRAASESDTRRQPDQHGDDFRHAGDCDTVGVHDRGQRFRQPVRQTALYSSHRFGA